MQRKEKGRKEVKVSDYRKVEQAQIYYTQINLIKRIFKGTTTSSSITRRAWCASAFYHVFINFGSSLLLSGKIFEEKKRA